MPWSALLRICCNNPGASAAGKASSPGSEFFHHKNSAAQQQIFSKNRAKRIVKKVTKLSSPPAMNFINFRSIV
jgi:hypothetical protein